MSGAREQFESRLSADKAMRGGKLVWDERGAWELYSCGWEDGIKEWISEQSAPSGQGDGLKRLTSMVCRFEGVLGLETPMTEPILDRLQLCIDRVTEASYLITQAAKALNVRSKL